MGEVEDQDVLNSAIIAAAQAVEHYEITRYGALIAWATELGHGNAARVLAESLKEEKATDAKLTAMAERKINPRADAKTDQGRARKRSGDARKRSGGARKTRRSAATRGAKKPRRAAAHRSKAPSTKRSTRKKTAKRRRA
jgi:hypothetical protein